MCLQRFIPCPDFDLEATLDSGQAFGWTRSGSAWEGVIANHWVRLEQQAAQLRVQGIKRLPDTRVIRHYLGLEDPLGEILASFGSDPVLAEAARACAGLRLLRQEPWECLAMFLMSSTKRIAQIRQVRRRLCESFGEPLIVPPGAHPAWQFPGSERLAASDEAALRECRMGFRAPHLLEAARRVTAGRLRLAEMPGLPLAKARAQLMELPGVGPKIADCVLLFSCGHRAAFPIDVWIARALRRAYFGGRPVPLRDLQAHAEGRFGPWAGYAQQYLFHYARLHGAFSG